MSWGDVCGPRRPKGGFCLSINFVIVKSVREPFVQSDPGVPSYHWSSEGLLARTSNKPLQDRIQVGFFFCAYAVAAHLAMGDAL